MCSGTHSVSDQWPCMITWLCQKTQLMGSPLATSSAAKGMLNPESHSTTHACCICVRYQLCIHSDDCYDTRCTGKDVSCDSALHCSVCHNSHLSVCRVGIWHKIASYKGSPFHQASTASHWKIGCTRDVDAMSSAVTCLLTRAACNIEQGSPIGRD